MLQMLKFYESFKNTCHQVIRSYVDKRKTSIRKILNYKNKVKVTLPDYLVKTYYWAYLSPQNVRLLDHHFVVNTILFGYYRKLQNWFLDDLDPDASVLQPAAVYGDLSQRTHQALSDKGFLHVEDISRIQLANTRRKLKKPKNVAYKVADASDPDGCIVDVVNCFFLLHEVPDDYKERIINSLLDRVAPNGKAVFVDYHQYAMWHPLRPIMSFVYKYLEPYARGLLNKPIKDFAEKRDDFVWDTETCFMGLYQKTTAQRKS